MGSKAEYEQRKAERQARKEHLSDADLRELEMIDRLDRFLDAFDKIADALDRISRKPTS